jgi:hypothetical protein
MAVAVDDAALEPVIRKQYPAVVVAKAKALYVLKGMQPRDIALKLQVEPKTVSNWAAKYGWLKLRNSRLDQLEKAAEQTELSSDEEFASSIAAQTEDLAEDTFDLARKALTAEDAKALAATSQAAVNFVKLYRQARGLDAAKSQTLNITAVFNRFGASAQPSAGGGDAIDV